MSIEINRITGNDDIKTVAELAKTIWNEHYTPIIGQEQVDYMIEKFQSEEAVSNQISQEDYEYYLINSEENPVGYIGIKLKENDLFLSKLYLLNECRGKGIGSEALAFIIGRAGQLHANSISLTVNKNNINSIRAYEKMGFQNLGPIVADIGNGYLMDDYIMKLPLD
jgi:diamine N-acetyltransferase